MRSQLQGRRIWSVWRLLTWQEDAGEAPEALQVAALLHMYSWRRADGSIVSAGMQVIRVLMFALGWPILTRTGYGLNWKQALVLSW